MENFVQRILASDIPDLYDEKMIYLPTYDSSEAMRHRGAAIYKYSFEYDKIGRAFGNGEKRSNVESPFHAEDLVYVMGHGYGTFTAKDDRISEIYSSK